MSDLPLEIDVHTLRQMRQGGQDLVILDVREPDEYATASIAGSILIPLGELPNRVAELEPHRHRPIIVHCHHGGRSMRATKWLREQGYAQAQNLAGGIEDWSLQVDPSVPRY
ncbi:MAG: rhodanese-like domain-containing protein [Pirellulales bacterium]|nr:rhodanese-like domain-containing protein [Pirellulales bacterium]